MRLIIDKYPSILFHHLNDILSIKYNIKFITLLRIWVELKKPNMIKFEEILKGYNNAK